MWREFSPWLHGTCKNVKKKKKQWRNKPVFKRVGLKIQHQGNVFSKHSCYGQHCHRLKSAFRALGIKQGLKIYLTVCHVILHVFKHHRKDESTRVGLYVSAGAIFSFFTHFTTKFSEKKISTDITRHCHVPQARLHHKNLLKSTHFCQNTGPLRRHLFLVPDCITDHFLPLQYNAKCAKQVSAKGLF